MPHPAIPAGVSGCASDRAGFTTDCVARGLPPGAAVRVIIREPTFYQVDFLPPVDPKGNVPFPYGRPNAGTTIFEVTAGGVFVTFKQTFIDY